ncbi:helix-turn-helix domain-containing protein [Nosocomiicoccus massiliensis]|uniref:Helix-turn-helix transcriptional regulator n=1 Tax=Nosocomiicoccus massiliensis TaxID=1232430 RepID=A0AAF0YJY9_9STAP|nr:helix-turn-helix transcriptional regulator [Nosocomiicoccus massiliensis]WOS96780.1 helix-turn-helix transcriptional regulator [Nosocomiicoccus massiliensis]
MIKSRLAVLMAERGLKISDVYYETGISKTTLMAISENTGKGVQYETVDRLCNYLGVTPCEFFEYSPYMIDLSTYFKSEREMSNLTLKVKKQSYEKNFYFTLSINSDPYYFPIDKNDYTAIIRINLEHTDLYDNEEFYKILDDLTVSFRTDFLNELVYKSKKLIIRAIKENHELDKVLIADKKNDIKQGDKVLIRLFEDTRHEKLKRMTLS